MPNISGVIQITINHKRLKKLISLDQHPIARAGEDLDKPGTVRIFSQFDVVSSCYQITVHKDTTPLTAFCTPTRLIDWLAMPQGSSAAPG